MIKYQIGTKNDSEEIAALHATSWKNTYRGIMSDRYLDEEIDAERREFWIDRNTTYNPNQMVIKATKQGKICGFACHFLDYDPVHGHYLDNLHVLKDFQGLGIGRTLLKLSIAHCLQFEKRPYFLWVFEKNKSARSFYERHGGTIKRETSLSVPGQCAVDPALLYQWDQPEKV